MTTIASSPTASTSKLFDEPPHKGIEIQDWTVTSTKTPISNAAESEQAAASLHLPLPEICFGNNKLEIKNEKKGVKLDWGTIEALKVVNKESGLKVAHAEEWAAGQRKAGSENVEVQKPFDWTYTTLYSGSTSSSSNATFEPASSSHPGIPLHLLARQDIPILFYDEVPLFEDELGDNGIAELVVRVRVNAFSVFVLSRFFLRIDHVLFRIFDVRLYHAFDSDEIVRETKGRQATYSDVKARLPLDRPNDLTPLTDINWVSATLEHIATSPPRRTKKPLGVPGMVNGIGRMTLGGSGTGPPVPTEVEKGVEVERWEAEGRKLEVLKC